MNAIRRDMQGVNQGRFGYTLAEVMIAVSILTLVVGGAIPAFIMCLKTSTRNTVDLSTAQEASSALSRIVYGVGAQYGLRSAVASTVTGVPATGNTWTVTYADIAGWTNSFSYDGVNDVLTYSNADFPNGVNIGRNIIAANVSNMASSLGITITLTCCCSNGQYCATNVMTTSVRWRN